MNTTYTKSKSNLKLINNLIVSHEESTVLKASSAD